MTDFGNLVISGSQTVSNSVSYGYKQVVASPIVVGATKTFDTISQSTIGRNVQAAAAGVTVGSAVQATATVLLPGSLPIKIAAGVVSTAFGAKAAAVVANKGSLEERFDRIEGTQKELGSQVAELKKAVSTLSTSAQLLEKLYGSQSQEMVELKSACANTQAILNRTVEAVCITGAAARESLPTDEARTVFDAKLKPIMQPDTDNTTSLQEDNTTTPDTRNEGESTATIYDQVEGRIDSQIKDNFYVVQEGVVSKEVAPEKTARVLAPAAKETAPPASKNRHNGFYKEYAFSRDDDLGAQSFDDFMSEDNTGFQFR